MSGVVFTPDGARIEVTRWCTLAGLPDMTTSSGQKYRPVKLAVTWHAYADETEAGPGSPDDWRALVTGPRVRKDGSMSAVTVDERFWSTHHDVPEWLRDRVAEMWLRGAAPLFEAWQLVIRNTE